MKKLLYIILMLLLASPVFGATYYVTSAGASGQTGADMANAWSWANFVAGGAGGNTWGAGDTVCLSGAFSVGSGTNTILSGGSGGTYATIDGSGAGDCVAASAATITPSFADSTFALRWISRNYVKVKDLTFAGTSYAALRTDSCTYFEFTDNTITGAYNRGIWPNCSDHIIINGNTLNNTSDVTDYKEDGIKIDGSSNVEVYNNSVTDYDHDAYQIYDNSACAVSTVDIHDNYATLTWRGYGRAFNIYEYQNKGTSNVFIHHNYAENMRAPSQMDGDISNIRIHNNIFYNQLNCCAEVSGACAEVSTDSKCFGDDAYQKTGRHWLLNSEFGSPEYVYIYNNTFYKSAETAIFINGIYDFLDISNNIIYDAANAATPGDDPPGSTGTYFDYSIVCKTTANCTNITFKNNVIQSTKRGVGGDEFSWQIGSNLYSLSEFEASPPSGVTASGSIDDTPDLTDPAGDDFSIATVDPVSPCIDVGANLGGDYDEGWNPTTSMPPVTVTTIDQDMRGSTPFWEIGAYVYDSDPVTDDPITITPGAPGNLTITPDAGGAITITY